MVKLFEKKELLWLTGIVAIGLLVFASRIHLHSLDYVGDYKTYVATAQYFGGMDIQPSMQRILKPLEPLANAALAPLFGWRRSFLLIVALFYVLLAGVTWIFFRKIFKKIDLGPHISLTTVTAIGTALFMLSYPMLRYGLDAYTETGALFFYIAALVELWWFVRWSNWRPLLATLAACTLGFFWKEYTALPVLMMQIAILWHPQLKGQWKKKVFYLMLFDGIFVLINLVWQFYIYQHFHYNYLDWYNHGGANHFSSDWSPFVVLKSLFALLIAGWLFIPFVFLERKRLPHALSFYFWLILTVPLLSLGWGAVSSRLFYVLLPALLVLTILGIWHWRKNSKDMLAITLIILVVDWAWLFLRP